MDQIDVLEPSFQTEIENIVKKIETFEPTILVIEQRPEKQGQVDSLFQEYLNDNHKLERVEWQQIGFRLARKLNITQIYCVDEWGEFNEQVKEVIKGKDSLECMKFSKYYEENPDLHKRYSHYPNYRKNGILKELIELNKPENIRKSLGNYLIGPFKYESNKGDFFGVNFETGRWFNRNLKIFRNIQRINLNPEDKILVIYGSGHLNILNILFKNSPEFKLKEINKYLKSP
ncbi:DUF5694 domain-containing protein [Christiangramia gaetbulicola]|nr:DUF5694 domain-containing protein [Christiangramia gaetbulicola]